MIPYQKTQDPEVVIVGETTGSVSIKKLIGTYWKIITPVCSRAIAMIARSEMHVDRWASATDSTMIISERLRSQLSSLR